MVCLKTITESAAGEGSGRVPKPHLPLTYSDGATLRPSGRRNIARGDTGNNRISFSMHDACATAILLNPFSRLSTFSHNWYAAADSSKPHSLPPNHVHPNQRSNSVSRLPASHNQPPHCIIAPANAVSKKPAQLPLHSFHRLLHNQPHTSHASPRTPAAGADPGPRQSRGDDAENNHFAHFQSPASAQMGSQTAQKRRKQKRPQWQDVSIDLTAVQAAQEQAGPNMSHADRPVGRNLSTDTAGAAHMSGVSPASPSPPRQHLQNNPFLQHKSRSSVPTLPALASAGSSPPEALAARHENLAFDHQHHHHQQYQHGLGQNVGAAGGSLQLAYGPLRASQQQQSSHVQLPNCLSPLHHQPHAPSLQSSADFAPLHRDGATQAHQHQHMSWSRDRADTHTPAMSPTHHASDNPLSSTSHYHVEGLDGFAPGPFRQAAAYEDPRSAQQVPLQYLRHPCGPGAPGGLHRLHRLLRPIDRSQHRTAASNTSIPEAGNTAWAANAVTELPQHSDDSSQPAAAAEPDSMQHAWHAQPPHAQSPHAQPLHAWPPQHKQRQGSMERKGKPQMMHQQPARQAPAAHHTAYRGWQEDDGCEQQHQPEVPVSGPCNSTHSSDAQAAGDMRDLNTRLQQV